MKAHALYAVAALAAILSSACSSADTETALMEALGVNARAAAPVFLGSRAVSETEIRFGFSKPVTLVSAAFSPDFAADGADDGSDIVISAEETPEGGSYTGGRKIKADLLVEDADKNTLNVLTEFRTRNGRLPRFLITEIRTETSKPKGEFVELKMLEDGNLGALRMFVATNTMDAPTFEFDPVEVKKGDYVVIHLRTYEDGAENEYGNDLKAATATGSSASRDFWLSDSTERLRITDAVFFLDQDDAVIDAALFSNDGTWGGKTKVGNMAKAADLLHEKGAWKTASGGVPLPADAFSSAGTTNTRTICRDETAPDTDAAADWYITKSSGATPGKPNNPARYVPK
jgi:hypothetical protein